MVAARAGSMVRTFCQPSRALERQLKNPLDRLLEVQPGRLGRHREEAGVGEPRDRVHLEHLGPPVAQDQVDAGEP